MNNYTFIKHIIKPFKWLILGQISVGIFWAIDISLRPYIIKIITDRITTMSPADAIAELSWPIYSYILLSLAFTSIFRFYDFIWLKLNSPLKRHICLNLMQKMMQHSANVFHNQFAGNLANKIKDVMSGVPDIIKLIIEKAFSTFLALLLAIFTVLTINYKFSIILIAWMVVFVIGSWYFSKRAKKLCIQAAEVKSNVIGQLVDILGNISSVHLFAGRKLENKNLTVHMDEYVSSDQRRDWWFLRMFAFQGLSFVIYQAIGLILLMHDFRDGIVTAGDFTMLVTINISIIHTLWSLTGDILRFSELSGNIDQGLNIALAPIEVQEQPNAKDLVVTNGAISFEQVKFHYKGTEPLFDKKSITIPAKQKVGLVGYSGSGKSTFVNLILRLFDINAGEILIDGQNVKYVTKDSLRQGIAIIPQDPALFHRSLFDNIRYSLPEATREQVVNAAKKAHAHEFIMKLPEQYDSLVGERGVKLSGGQRQRIAIARAVLKNASILILDEATSQLDSLTENEIQDSLLRLMEDKTTIVIAHRLSTLLHMDRILVFAHGKIVEDGSHQDLIALERGLYKSMWDAQVGGFLPE